MLIEREQLITLLIALLAPAIDNQHVCLFRKQEERPTYESDDEELSEDMVAFIYISVETASLEEKYFTGSHILHTIRTKLMSTMHFKNFLLLKALGRP